jgi:hypothetical protein
VAANLGWSAEEHRADWMAPCRDTCTHPPRRPGERCPAQGNYRNAHMVSLGADCCVAFYLRGAKNAGTADCAKRAHGAGIRVKPVRIPRNIITPEQGDLFDIGEAS